MWISGLQSDLIIVVVCTFVSIMIVGFVAVLAVPDKDRKTLLPLMFGLAILGTIAGLAGGTSRVGVVGDIVPAALALIGSVSVYVFGVQPKNGMIVSFSAAAFALSLGLGYAAGAGKRGPIDAYDRRVAFCETLLSDAKILTSDIAMYRVAVLHGETCSNVLGTEFFQTFRPELRRDKRNLDATIRKIELDFKDIENQALMLDRTRLASKPKAD
ncbi:hypothetical protein LCL97_05345 [Seohaeicola saemankumensis]|nr:hypothetical protein [Seohaeicola saemankumensis]MCA0870236.1 hypothetical protein [Seohaeicola saemankumensis]